MVPSSQIGVEVCMWGLQVLRDGREVLIDMKDVVPGDIVLLSAGDLIPGDVRLLETRNLSIRCAAAPSHRCFPAIISEDEFCVCLGGLHLCSSALLLCSMASLTP